MRYKKFLINYKEEVVGHLPNGDEITISEMHDLAGEDHEELITEQTGYTRKFFREQIERQWGADYLFDDADYIDTDITLQGKNVDKWVNTYLKEEKLNDSTKKKYRDFIKIIGATVLFNHYRFLFWGHMTIQKKKDVYTKGIYNQHLSAKTVENTLNYLLKIGRFSLKLDVTL